MDRALESRLVNEMATLSVLALAGPRPIVLGAHFVEPVVVQSFLERDALFRLFGEQPPYEILAVLRVAGPLRRVKYDWIFARHPYGFLLGVVIERQGAAQKGIDDAAQGPEIA